MPCAFTSKIGRISGSASLFRKWDAKHECDADCESNSDLKGADAVGKGEGVFTLNEIISCVIDACARNKREDAAQEKNRHGRFKKTAQMRARKVRGMTASKLAANGSSPCRIANS